MRKNIAKVSHRVQRRETVRRNAMQMLGRSYTEVVVSDLTLNLGGIVGRYVMGRRCDGRVRTVFVRWDQW